MEKIRCGEEILADLSNWELFYRYNSLKGVRNKQTGQEVETFDCGEYEYYVEIIGELGYRKNIWTDYDNDGEWLLEKVRKEREWKKEMLESELFSQNQNIPVENSNPQSQLNQDTHTTPVPQSTSNSVKQVSIQPKNNSFPSTEQVQKLFDQDKGRKLVINDGKNTNSAELLLKLVISAELLIKQKKGDSDLLNALLAEKEKKSSVYQSLNQNQRIDNAIQGLRKNQLNTNNSNINHRTNNNIQALLLILFIIIVFLIISAGTTTKMRKRN